MENIFKNIIVMHPNDNVGISTCDQTINNVNISLGHKIALKQVEENEAIIKYGSIIGNATSKINKYDHVHTHNMTMPREIDSFRTIEKSLNNLYNNLDVHTNFKGYLRQDGRAGTRNYILVLSSVNCSATVVKNVCRHFINRNLPPKIDGVVPIVHMQGCAQAIGGKGYNILNSTLAGWLFHPNVVGALVVELGCEQTTLDSILNFSSFNHDSTIKLEKIVIQESGGTSNAINESISKIEKIINELPSYSRVNLPISKLSIALNCGGSDALSGITANPAVGQVSDFIVTNKGTSILAEIPECHGTEDILLNRCANVEAKNKLSKIFDWWRQYVHHNKAELNSNLALGNLKGGISTIVEKSLGAVAKAGNSNISEVLDYAEKPKSCGLHVMNTPGFDPVSVTGLVAAGCNLVVFTTGRGSTYGCAICPTVKISSNTELYNKMMGDIDIDAGKILNESTMSDVSKEIFNEIIEVASGKKTSSENLGLGWEEFVPWQLGETL